MRAVLGLDDLHGARQLALDLGRAPRARPASSSRSALLSDDEVGAEELVLEHLLQRVVVVDGWSSPARWAASAAGSSAKRPAATAGAVDHRDDAVDGDARADRRPVEGLHQRLRQRQAGGLDDDVLGRVGAASSSSIAGTKSSATVQQMQPLASSTMSSLAALDAAAREDRAVDADVAELVDDEREAPPAGILEDVADERRLAGAEEAGDDGAGDLLHDAHSAASARFRPRAAGTGGMRATTPLRKASGRCFQGTIPSGVSA